MWALWGSSGPFRSPRLCWVKLASEGGKGAVAGRCVAPEPGHRVQEVSRRALAGGSGHDPAGNFWGAGGRVGSVGAFLCGGAGSWLQTLTQAACSCPPCG